MSSNLTLCVSQNITCVRAKFSSQIYKLLFIIFKWVKPCDVINIELFLFFLGGRKLNILI